jgi:hypothetical protein
MTHSLEINELIAELEERANLEDSTDAEDGAFEDVPEITWRELREMADLMRRAAKALKGEAGGAWRPISTAPTDGTTIVMLRASGQVSIGCWSDYHLHNAPRFTHWMPLPSPQPSSETAKKAEFIETAVSVWGADETEPTTSAIDTAVNDQMRDLGNELKDLGHKLEDQQG